jgi:hypothetical protein
VRLRSISPDLLSKHERAEQCCGSDGRGRRAGAAQPASTTALTRRVAPPPRISRSKQGRGHSTSSKTMRPGRRPLRWA